MQVVFNHFLRATITNYPNPLKKRLIAKPQYVFFICFIPFGVLGTEYRIEYRIELLEKNRYMSVVKEASLAALDVDQSYSTVNVVSDADVVKFSEVTGDVNPIHLDNDYAKKSIFGTRIAHGMISAGYISAIFGTKFPGPGSIYLSQSLKFRAPVKIGDTVNTTVTITDINQKRKRVILSCECRVGEVVVLTGEAQLMVPA